MVNSFCITAPLTGIYTSFIEFQRIDHLHSNDYGSILQFFYHIKDSFFNKFVRNEILILFCVVKHIFRVKIHILRSEHLLQSTRFFQFSLTRLLFFNKRVLFVKRDVVLYYIVEYWGRHSSFASLIFWTVYNFLYW